MALIAPFKGVIYKHKAIPNLVDVLAPPYDVISPDKQAELYSRHSRNVVRLILGNEFPEDNELDSRHTRSARYLKNWLEDSTLGYIEDEAIYLYAQEYEMDNIRLRRSGIICKTKIEELGHDIYPHERTHSGPKLDRLKLTRACRMNFSQVFGIYRDKELILDKVWERVMTLPADMDVTDCDGVRHQMWVIADVDIIENTRSFFKKTPIVIADGHHRYETAINYRNERRAQEGSSGSDADYEYVMMYLSNACGQGFTVLPTHRIVVDISGASMDEVEPRLKNDFNIAESRVDTGSLWRFLDELKISGVKNPSIGLYHGEGRMLLLSLKESHRGAPSGNEADEVLRRLDVVVLQELILEKALGISKEAVESKKGIRYTIDARKAIEAVDNKDARFSFIMNSSRIDQIMDVAIKGGVMPQKSTYFYPKLISGFVFNPL